MNPTGSITVHVPLAIRPRPGRKTIVRPEGSAPSASIAAHADPATVKALARAFRWKRLLDNGRYASISEIAAAEKIDRGYVGSILRLSLLAPDIIQNILDGRQPMGLALSDLLKPFPPEWERQRARWLITLEPIHPPLAGSAMKNGARLRGWIPISAQNLPTDPTASGLGMANQGSAG